MRFEDVKIGLRVRFVDGDLGTVTGIGNRDELYGNSNKVWVLWDHDEKELYVYSEEIEQHIEVLQGCICNDSASDYSQQQSDNYAAAIRALNKKDFDHQFEISKVKSEAYLTGLEAAKQAVQTRFMGDMNREDAEVKKCIELIQQLIDDAEYIKKER